MLEQLRLCEKMHSQLQGQDDVENGRWLELLHPRTAVKHLWLYSEFGARITRVLQELVGESGTEVLPAMRPFLGRAARKP